MEDDKQKQKLIAQIQSAFIKMKSFYKCPENCNVCCRNGKFDFIDMEYRNVLAKVKPEKQEQLDALIVIPTKQELIEGGISSQLAEEAMRAGIKHFTTDVCPLLENGKCSVESTKFVLCRMYPLQASDVHKEVTIRIIPCSLGLDLIYDFVASVLYVQYVSFGSLNDVNNECVLQPILDCYNGRFKPDSEDAVNVIVDKFSLQVDAFFLHEKLINNGKLPLIHELGLVVKQTIESCAGMKEVEENKTKNLIEKIESIIDATEGKTIKEAIENFKAQSQTQGYKFSKEMSLKDNLDAQQHQDRGRTFVNDVFLEILETYPIIKIDDSLEPLIVDTELTKPTATEFNMPYPAFFLDKVFEIDSGFIMGIAIYDILAVLEYMNKKYNGRYKAFQIGAEEQYREECDSEDAILSKYKISFVYVPKNSMTMENSREIVFISGFFHTSLEVMLFNFSELRRKTESKFPIENEEEFKLSYKVSKEAFRYLLNTIFLINNHIDIKNPNNKNNDFRMIPYYPDKKAKRWTQNRFSVIKVFGKMHEYVTAYNKERRKYTKHELNAILVRGHWRLYSHPKYKNMHGKTQWIAPFIKGIDRELYQKVIKIEP